MPAAWQASGTLLGALTTADVTPVIPAHQADDILICVTANRVTTNTCATPSGWTLLTGSPRDSTGWRTYAFWKRATSAAETNPLCDWTATSADKYAQVHTIRGAIKSGDWFSAHAMTSDLTSPLTFTEIISTLANQLIVVVGLGSDNLATSVTVTGTDPSSYTQRHFSTITTGADAAGWFHDAVRASAGATGNPVYTFDAAMPAGSALVAAVIDEPVALPGVYMARART